MYAMPTDMRNGKLADGMEERFPHHVGLRALAAGKARSPMAIHRDTMEINAWLNEHVARGAYQFRKNFSFAEDVEISPFDRPYGQPTYCFKRYEDAIAFKLRWVTGL
jgi:hypothetical protein